MHKEVGSIDRSRGSVGDVRVMFVKSGFTSEGFCPTLQVYDRAANKMGILRTEGCKMHEQRVYASRGLLAERKIFTSFVVVRNDRDVEKEIWVARVLFLCLCFVKRDMESVELGFVQYMRCVSLLKQSMRHCGVSVCDEQQGTVKRLRVRVVGL